MEPTERRNALKCTACDSLHGTGMGLVAVITVLPLLFRSLGAGKVELGLLYSIGTAGFIVGQPVGMFVLGRRRRTKRFFVRWVLSLWVPCHLAMGAAIYLLAPAQARLCRYVVLLLFAVVTLGDGMVIPIWIDWQASLFRRAGRGLAMGMIAGAWALGQGVGSLGAGNVRAHLQFPLNYSLLFLVAALLFAASTGLLRRVQEPERITAERAPWNVADLFGFLKQSLRQRNFRSYLVSRALLTAGGGAAAFYAIHFGSAEGGGLNESTVIMLGAVTALSQGVSGMALGRLGDLAGHKAGVAVGCLAQFAAIGVAYLARSSLACAACFALVGVSWAAAWVSHNNMLFETCPHENRIAHIALSNTLLGPLAALAPVGMGLLMEHVGIRNGIAFTLVPTMLATLWLLLAVREPRKAGGSVHSAGAD